MFKKRDLTEKKKRCNETENDVAWSRTRFICSCKPLLDHCTTVTHTIFGRLSTDISNGYLLTIDQVSTDHRPSVDQLLTDTVISAEIHLERLSTDYPPCFDRVSTDYRLSLDRLSTAISTNRSVDTTYSKRYPFRLARIFRFCEICSEYRTAGHLVFSTR